MSADDEQQRRHDELMAQLRRNNQPRPTDFLASMIIGGAVGWLIAAFVLPIAAFFLLILFVAPQLAIGVAVLIALAVWAIHRRGKRLDGRPPVDHPRVQSWLKETEER
jgi:uncharacterized membrane protein